MSTIKKILAGKILLILILAGALAYADTALDLKLGLDLKGGTQLDYKMDLSSVEAADQAQIVEGVQEVIRKRVDGLGVSEPNIYVSSVADEYHIIVELAGITEIEEAKETVGKTIQLEFREENTEPSGDKVAEATGQATTFYNAILAGGNFEELAETDSANYGMGATWQTIELQDVSTLSEDLQTAIEGKGIGAVLAPFEINEGYVMTEDGILTESQGMAVVQITDKQTTSEETSTEEKVSARHILIAYEGAERSTATRTQDEAQTLANELSARMTAGELMEDLAGEHSDDTGSGAQGGDLGEFGRGMMTQAFEDSAFSLGIDEISGLIETEFGYHIIQTYAKIGGESETLEVTTISLNKIVYSTTPDPWKEEAVLTGEHFKHADVQLNDAYQPYVSIVFNDEGADLFEELTEANVGKRIAIFVGGNLISAPNVQQTIAGGNAQITGNFSLEEAQTLARDLNTGAIPAPIELVGQYTISATLGEAALSTSLNAGLIGLAILALYMLFYYRLPGLIATVALAIYSILLIFAIKISMPTGIALIAGLALFSYLTHLILKNKDSGGEKFISFLLACVVLFFVTFVLTSKITLTLAGIAGVILSIGMAVDANVLIFERTKEELASGKSLKDSIDDGFNRAWDSIRDSNFSSLITCGILFYFGSSIIRGFALNLALGILLSMFSAIMLTRTMLHFAESTKLSKKLWLFGKPRIARKNPLQIIKNTRIWAIFSGTLLTASIIVTLIFGLNLGLDFTGGTLLEVQLGSEEATIEGVSDVLYSVEEEMQAAQALEMESIMVNEAATEVATETATTEGVTAILDGEEITAEPAATPEVTLTDFGTPQIVSTNQGTFIARLKHVSESEHDAIMAKLTENFGSAEEIRFTTVGPTIGETLKQKAIVALFITLIMIVLYISFAFRRIPKEVSPWRFGMCAIAALVHDVLIVLGVFVLLGRFAGIEIDALFITALLTIMGFSVHDTIVVFDRVRENLHFRSADEDLAATTNKALNQTMARSLNTSISTLITVVALLILGADSIRMFVLALTIGIIAGTYSSIFVASPLLVWWNDKANK